MQHAHIVASTVLRKSVEHHQKTLFETKTADDFTSWIYRATINELKQEAQLMLTNPRDALRGQSRSPNMVPFDMLTMVSY